MSIPMDHNLLFGQNAAPGIGHFFGMPEGDADEFYSALNSFMEERFSILFSSGGMHQLGRFPADLGGKAGTYLYDFTLEFPMMHKIAWHCSDIPFFFHNTDKVEICRRSDPAPGILVCTFLLILIACSLGCWIYATGYTLLFYFR